MKKENGLHKLETFLLWLLIGELAYTLFFSIIAIFALPSDAIWSIFYDHIRAGTIIPLMIAFLFNLGGALIALVSYIFQREDSKEAILKPGILFNWIIVAVFSFPYLILLLQMSFDILNRVKFFETYF
jgi:hypothetical protein